MNTSYERLNASKKTILDKMKKLMSDPKVRTYASLASAIGNIDSSLEEASLDKYRECNHEIVVISDNEFNGHYYGCIKCGLTSYSDYLVLYSKLSFDDIVDRIGTNRHLHELEKEVKNGKLVSNSFHTKEEFESLKENGVKPYVKTSI